jgi:hypothetical protein
MFKKNKNLCRVPESGHSAKNIYSKNKKSLPSAGEHSAKKDTVTYGNLCRVLSFAERPTLGTETLCQVSAFAECVALGKGHFA